MSTALRIGEVARRTGTTPRTIRYYEEIGLLPADTEREHGQTRTYDEGTVERVQEIVRLRDLLGLSLDELRDLVAAEDARALLRREWRQTPSRERRAEIVEEALGHIGRQLELVRRRRTELERLEAELTAKRRRLHEHRRELGRPE